MDRRGFLASAALLGLAADAVAQAPALRARRSVSTMPANDPDLLALRRGLAAMDAANTDPAAMTPWRDLANMHWHPDGEPAGGLARRYWRSCQHRNEHFLPFHRAFLLLFETLIRQASGYSAFSLPYWDGVGDPALPEVFRLPTIDGAPNPLFHKRDPGVNAGQPINAPQKRVAGIIESCSTFRGACNPHEGDWGGFGGQGDNPGVKGEVENAPHNWIHGELKGDMNDPNTAARDPIFWLHHANIDRLWVVWRARNAAHVDPTDAWRRRRWAFGNPLGHGPREFAWRTEQLLDTRAIAGGLSYQYDNETDAEVPGPNLRALPPRGAPAKPRAEMAEAPPPLRSTGAPNAPGGGSNRAPAPPPARDGVARLGAQTLSAGGATAVFNLPALAPPPLRSTGAPSAPGGGNRAPAPPPAAATRRGLALVLHGVRAPRDGPSYEIYLNLPDRPAADAAPYFVGAITAWEVSVNTTHHHSGHAMHDPMADAFVFPLQDDANAHEGAQLSISIVPVGAPAANGDTLSFESAEIVPMPG